MALNLGGIIRLTYAVRNDAGALVNPSTVTLTITQPDGTAAAGTTVTLPPAVTGNLVHDFTTTQAGLHSVHWATTVPTTAEDDVFVVEAPARMLVSVDEAVNHLGAAGVITSDADRETLQWLCLAMTEGAELDLGRVLVRRTIVEERSITGDAVFLRTPVISMTSVSVNGGLPLAGSDYRVDEYGILRSRYGWGSSGWPGTLSLAYVAGYGDPPRCVRYAVLGEIQHGWQTSQQAFHPGLDEFDAERGLALAAPSGQAGMMQRAYDSMRAVGVA